jgi:photosystem II stability/assembly factor-like uncharacterized protein
MLRSLLFRSLSLVAAAGIVGAATAQIESILPPNVVDQMRWREIGPASMGGRVIRLAVDEANDIWYVGTASGGLWKTADRGQTFEGLFQHEEVNSIGCVAVSKSHPNVLWIGTGENNPRNSAIYGLGVYKSEDGGRTWTNMGLKETRHIGRIAIHPTNPDIVYVGAMGRTWGTNEERGLYKTVDGGRTWEKILYVDEQTGVIDLQLNPNDPNTLLAATWQRQRGIHDDGEPAMSDGVGSGVWKSTDGGRNWRRLGPQNGLFEGRMGRTGIDYHRADPNIVYLITGGARLSRDRNGVWKSTDGGENWAKVNDIAPRPMYYSKLRVDPTNPDIVFVLGVQLARSTDGGKTFANLPLRGVHVDHHCLWINPKDPKHVLLGNDGGFYESDTGGTSFRAHKMKGLGQFYHVAVDNRRDYRVAGGLQDNGTWYGPSMRRGSYGPTNRDFRSIGGGDGFVVRFHPEDPNLVYLESQNGNIRRTYLGPRENAPQGTVRRPAPPQGEREAWAWKTDFILSPHDPNVYLTAGQFVYRCETGGTNLKRISPRLGLTERGMATAIAKSPVERDVIYVGTDDGALWITRDGGANWTNLSDQVGMPLRAYVSTIEASRFAAGRCYVAFDAHRSDDDRPFLFVTEDYGQTWREITSNLPEFGSTRSLREDTKNENLLYVGTEFFTYASIDRGRTWTRINNNLPTVAVHDFAVSDAAAELVAGTHGRSLWALDISWLRQVSPETFERPAHLFRPHSAVLWQMPEEEPPAPQDQLVGENPVMGASFFFWLQNASPFSKLTVRDASGAVVAEIDKIGVAGLNRAVWDLSGATGRVAPGVYRVTLEAGGHRLEEEFEVVPDPEAKNALKVRPAA